MQTTTTHPIGVFESPNVLKGATDARRGWEEAVSTRCKGWGIITAESHRVSAIKRHDLVHFAPVGANFDAPTPLDSATKELAIATALQWCSANLFAVTLDSVLTEIEEELRRSKKAIRASRLEMKSASLLEDKLAANERLKAAESMLHKRRVNIFAAEDAIRECASSSSLAPFSPFEAVYPTVARKLKQLVAKQLRPREEGANQSADSACSEPATGGENAYLGKSIVGVFTKQVWGGRKGDDAIWVGEETFDATDQILNMSLPDIQRLQDNDWGTDDIGQKAIAWDGPCEVRIVESIKEFFGIDDLEELTLPMLESARHIRGSEKAAQASQAPNGQGKAALIALNDALKAATQAGVLDELADLVAPDTINRFCDAVTDACSGEMAASSH